MTFIGSSWLLEKRNFFFRSTRMNEDAERDSPGRASAAPPLRRNVSS